MNLYNKLRVLKDYFKVSNTGCNKVDCYQGRNCSCQPINFSEAIMEVHKLASKVPYVDMGLELRQIADRLAQIGNNYQERQYPSINTKENS